MKTSLVIKASLTLTALAGSTLTSAGARPEPTPSLQAAASTYQPKFPGDPARSSSEASALGYMRVVLRAQREYKKRHGHFAESLTSLAGTGSLTKRMARSTDRGDYTVEFHSKPKEDGFNLSMIPKQYDDQHRAFFATDDGIIHAEEGKPATEESPKVK